MFISERHQRLQMCEDLILRIHPLAYWSDKGEEASISAAVNAVDLCAREPQGRAKCSKIADYDDGVAVATDFDAPTSGGVGGFLGGLFK